MSAWGYSSSSFENYDRTMKSMLISSSAYPPTAYILSLQKTSSLSTACTGQNLIKFDPVSSNPNPTWAKKTIPIAASPADCGHLGLEFGRSEELLYVYSWYNNLCTISMMTSNGNSIWQHSMAGGSRLYSNFIQYKNIDASTDLIVASSGSPKVSYHRILAFTSPPYIV
jgi:hypothetical protein